MRFPRTCGILLHPTSLASPHAIGDLGPEARRFVDWLEAAGQSIWQVLPLGPTGYGDSPYQCFSAFAGNTLMVSIEDLVTDGWLQPADLGTAPDSATVTDHAAATAFKAPLLRAASERFARDAGAAARGELEHFCAHNAEWLDDHALFRALKTRHEERPWTEWDPALVRREASALAAARERCAAEVHAERFAQWQFFVQWGRLRERCRSAGIHLMGDVPIFVAHDSADVWAHPDHFRLGPDGRPEVIAGVPPDYFSATGQCWGNPLYRWDVLERRGFGWWVARFRQSFATVDWVRVDHFRGFEAFWEIPGTDHTAVNGRWVKAPGKQLFGAVRRALGDLPIIAENLGLITPEVEALREELGFPGMAILQFAFGGDAQSPGFRPHNYTRDLVAYTGSHDNDTTVGWWTSTGVGDSTRSADVVASEKEVARLYLDLDGREVHWAMIRTLLASVADVAIVPMQDVLGLGTEARMNLPSRAGGNWGWRLAPAALTSELAERLRALAQVFGRAAAG